MSKNQREELPSETASRGIDVGCAVILESGDGKILLTRRATHLRTFPNVWVPPGIITIITMLMCGYHQVLSQLSQCLCVGTTRYYHNYHNTNGYVPPGIITIITILMGVYHHLCGYRSPILTLDLMVTLSAILSVTAQ